MDDYLDCLYHHIDEVRLDRALYGDSAYSKAFQDRETAQRALERTLKEDQPALLRRYQEAGLAQLLLEKRALFQEAVSLGKWLSR